MDKLKQITKWYISALVGIVFIICAMIYFKSIYGLDKPAGIVEAFKFLTTAPDEYFVCLFSGSVAKIAFTAIVIIALASIICLVKDLYDNKYVYGEIDVKNIIQYIMNCVIAIIIGKIQTEIISYFWTLVVTIGIIVVGIKLWMDN